MNPNQQSELLHFIREAQEVLSDMPMGGIGLEGPTKAELDAADNAGCSIEDDACYHQAQKAWLILERCTHVVLQRSR